MSQSTLGKGVVGSLILTKTSISAMHQVHLGQMVQGTNVSLLGKKAWDKLRWGHLSGVTYLAP